MSHCLLCLGNDTTKVSVRVVHTGDRRSQVVDGAAWPDIPGHHTAHRLLHRDLQTAPGARNKTAQQHLSARTGSHHGTGLAVNVQPPRARRIGQARARTVGYISHRRHSPPAPRSSPCTRSTTADTCTATQRQFPVVSTSWHGHEHRRASRDGTFKPSSTNNRWFSPATTNNKPPVTQLPNPGSTSAPAHHDGARQEARLQLKTLNEKAPRLAVLQAD